MADNQKKENFFKRAAKKIAAYAKATKSEVKKISWPTRKQLINNTAIVIVCIVIVSIVIFALDTFFGFGFNFLNDKKANYGLEEPAELTSDMIYDLIEDATAEAATDAE